MKQEEIIQKIKNERSRQFDLPGREFDVNNTPNDWSSIIGFYIFEEIRRSLHKPLRKDFEDSLIKAAAIILATLEHCHIMEINQHFADE